MLRLYSFGMTDTTVSSLDLEFTSDPHLAD